MNVHEWLHQSLSSNVSLVSKSKGGIMEASYMIQVPDAKPFIIHKLSGTSPLLSREENGPVRATPVQIYVHDEPGTYQRIADTLFEVQVALIGPPFLVPDADLVACRWEGDSSQIPEDPKTGTISQFSRFRIVHKP